MVLALQMVLAAHGVSMPSYFLEMTVSSRTECVSLCYFRTTCSSIGYDSFSNMCYLSGTVYSTPELVPSSYNFQYLVWEPSRTGGCRADYSWQEALNLCYRVYGFTKTWQKAEDHCVQDGGHLLKVDTPGINGFIKQRSYSEGVALWVGGNDKHVEGTWVWADNSTVQTTYWYPGQPENGTDDEDCMNVYYMGSGNQWCDAACWKTRKFVCQVEVTQQPLSC